MNRYGVSSTLPDGRDNPEYKRRWAKTHREKMRAYHRKWKGSHLELYQEAQRKFYFKNRKRAIEASSIWNKAHRERVRENERKWRKIHPERAHQEDLVHTHRRNRGLSTRTIIGSAFHNSVLHHLTPETAVYIPETLHKSIPHNIRTGKNMETINVLAMELFERGGLA